MSVPPSNDDILNQLVSDIATLSLDQSPKKSKNGGKLYEDRVYECVKITPFPLLKLLARGNTNSNKGTDLPLIFCSLPLPVEVKKKGAQMSGTSAYYKRESSTFTGLAKDIEDPELVLAAAQIKIPALNAYIDEAKKLEPEANITGMPINLKKSTRAALGKKGLNIQKDAESKFTHPIAFLRDFHNRKGIYYIQIEGSGFFSLGGNPFNFPVPELKGEFKLETRIGFAGSGGKDKVSAGYRIQGRLITSNKSPYSLDNIDDCKTLFSKDFRK